MKKHFSKALIVPAIFLMVLAHPSTLSAQLPFQGGEKLGVTVHYRCGFKADMATINVNLTEDRGVYSLTAEGSTLKFWDSLYKIRDTYSCTFLGSTMKPLTYRKDVQEGDYWAKAECAWSPDASVLHLVGDKRNRPHRDTTYSPEMQIRDVLNVVYHARTLNPDSIMNKPAHYLMIIDKDLLDVRIRFVGREKKKISDIGSFNALKFAVSIAARTSEEKDEAPAFALDTNDENALYGKEKIFFWFTDDENHLPIYFTSPLTVGSINGRINSYEGLRFPLNSLTEK